MDCSSDSVSATPIAVCMDRLNKVPGLRRAAQVVLNLVMDKLWGYGVSSKCIGLIEMDDLGDLIKSPNDDPIGAGSFFQCRVGADDGTVVLESRDQVYRNSPVLDHMSHVCAAICQLRDAKCRLGLSIHTYVALPIGYYFVIDEEAPSVHVCFVGIPRYTPMTRWSSRNVVPGTHHLGRRDALNIAISITKAVQALLDNGQVHLDLKLGNTVVDETIEGTPRALLCDLGSVAAVNALVEMRMYQTLHGLPPEFLSVPVRRATAAVMSWSLGCLLYHILWAKTPFTEMLSEHQEETLKTEHLAWEMTYHTRLANVKLPEQVTVMQMMVTNPGGRLSVDNALYALTTHMTTLNDLY